MFASGKKKFFQSTDTDRQQFHKLRTKRTKQTDFSSTYEKTASVHSPFWPCFNVFWTLSFRALKSAVRTTRSFSGLNSGQKKFSVVSYTLTTMAPRPRASEKDRKKNKTQQTRLTKRQKSSPTKKGGSAARQRETHLLPEPVRHALVELYLSGSYPSSYAGPRALYKDFKKHFPHISDQASFDDIKRFVESTKVYQIMGRRRRTPKRLSKVIVPCPVSE